MSQHPYHVHRADGSAPQFARELESKLRQLERNGHTIEQITNPVTVTETGDYGTESYFYGFIISRGPDPEPVPDEPD